LICLEKIKRNTLRGATTKNERKQEYLEKAVELMVTEEKNNKQYSDKPIRKYNVAEHSNADSEHEHRLNEKCQIIVNNWHIQGRMPQFKVEENSCQRHTHDHT